MRLTIVALFLLLCSFAIGQTITYPALSSNNVFTGLNQFNQPVSIQTYGIFSTSSPTAATSGGSANFGFNGTNIWCRTSANTDCLSAAGVSSFNTRTGLVTLNSTDINTALSAGTGINISSYLTTGIQLEGGNIGTAALTIDPPDDTTQSELLGTNHAFNLVVWSINNAGKGTFSSLATGGQYLSSISTGTAPFVLSSTTINSNLNADFLDGFHAGNSSTGKAMCWKDASNMGFCSSVVASDGSCSCN